MQRTLRHEVRYPFVPGLIPLAVLLAVGWLVLAASSAATAPVEVGLQPPAGPYLDSCRPIDATEGGYPWTHGTGVAVGVGQTFALDGAATLDRLTFRLRQDQNLAGEPFHVSLLERVDGEWETVATETGVLPADLPVDDPVYVRVDLVDRALVGGQTYAFHLEIAGGGNVNLARGEILHVGDDLCSGYAFRSAGNTPFEPLTKDLEYMLHGRDQTAGDLLLLRGDRFAVSAEWTDFLGASGTANPVALTDESGYFWFFSDTNVELVVKVLDGCPLNGRYWVFAAGLTNVEVRLRVEDLATQTVWENVNPLHRFYPPVLDTGAMATCP